MKSKKDLEFKYNKVWLTITILYKGQEFYPKAIVEKLQKQILDLSRQLKKRSDEGEYAYFIGEHGYCEKKRVENK